MKRSEMERKIILTGKKERRQEAQGNGERGEGDIGREEN